MTKIKAVTLIAVGIAFAAPSALIAQSPALEETRSNLKEWVDLKKLISEERSLWRVEKETLNEQIDLLDSEIQKLKDQIVAKEAEASEADKQRIELTEEEKKLKQSSAVVDLAIGDLEQRLLKMIELFPDALRNKESVKLLTERMPKDDRQARVAGLGARMQYVIGLLGEIEKFNNQINFDETMQLINGANVAVKTIYVGLAIGYYVDGTKTEAGILRPGPNGWVKEDRPDLADPIAQAIAFYQREAQEPVFVNLPISFN